MTIYEENKLNKIRKTNDNLVIKCELIQ